MWGNHLHPRTLSAFPSGLTSAVSSPSIDVSVAECGASKVELNFGRILQSGRVQTLSFLRANTPVAQAQTPARKCTIRPLAGDCSGEISSVSQPEWIDAGSFSNPHLHAPRDFRDEDRRGPTTILHNSTVHKSPGCNVLVVSRQDRANLHLISSTKGPSSWREGHSPEISPLLPCIPPILGS